MHDYCTTSKGLRTPKVLFSGSAHAAASCWQLCRSPGRYVVNSDALAEALQAGPPLPGPFAEAHV